VRSLSQGRPELAEKFSETIRSDSVLGNLATSPLLIRLLWQVFEARGELPKSSASLYSDFTDYLLSAWEQREHQKKGHKSSRPSLGLRQQILSNIALYLLEGGKVIFTLSEAVPFISQYSPDLTPAEISNVLSDLSSAGLLKKVSEEALCFVHASLQDFYAARAIAHDRSRVASLINRPYAQEAMLFAGGLVSDIGPIVEAAVEQRNFILAAKYVSRGLIRNQDLANYVVQEFKAEVGSPFIELLAATGRSEASESKADEEHAYDSLIARWDAFHDAQLNSYEKGRRFESFAANFFGQFFKIVSRNLNTENGELDLVLEITKLAPFWIEFGGNVLVECKNWATTRPLKEVGAFAYKVGRSQTKLAFFVSVAGFTSDALETLKHNASDSAAALIVPLTGEDLKLALLKKEDLEEFLKSKIRDIKYLRKY
jgi:hypothetical protein